jgi:predicted nucleotidyltransferase
MMTTLQAIQDQRQRLLAVAARHGARNLRVFGSVARGEADAASDLDLLVDLEPGRSLIDLGALLVELEALLGMRVDVVAEAGLRPAIRARILRTVVPL